MDPKKRKKVRKNPGMQVRSNAKSLFFQVRDQIMALLEETDDTGDNEDSCSSHSPSARDNDEECHVEPTENETLAV